MTGERDWTASVVRQALFLFLVLAFLALMYLGNIKNRREMLWDYDLRHWYAGGLCWWEGISPYQKAEYTAHWVEEFGEPPRDHATFVYPPTMALISLPLALMPWPAAALVFRIVNNLAAAGICFLCWRMMRAKGDRPSAPVSLGWYLGACAGLAAVSQCLTQGQNALLVVCGCLMAWHGCQEKRLGLFLAGFLLATIKPQVSMLALLYLLFRGGHRWFVYGAALSCAFSAAVLLAVPVPDLLDVYRGSLGSHLQYQEFNQWGSFSGVPALVGRSHYGDYYMIAGVLAGIAGTIWVGWRSERLPDSLVNRLRHGQLIWVMSFALMPVHIYDLVGQIFVTMTLWVLPGWRRRAVAFVCMVIADRSYTLARIPEVVGGPLAPLGPEIYFGGAPVMSGVLLILFFWWYWRDNRQSGAEEAVSR